MNRIKNKKDDDTKGLLMIAISIVILASFILIYFQTKQPTPDPLTGCIGKPIGSVSIILDLSERISNQTIDSISERVDKVVNEVARPNELISVYYVNDTSQTNQKDALNKCRPKDIDNASWADARRKIKKGFNEFKLSLKDSQLTPNSTGDSRQSPILQTVMDVYKKNKYQENKKLIVFSDLWEYTEDINMYACNDWRDVRSKFMDRWGSRPNFSDYQIYVGRIPREKHPKGYFYPQSSRDCRNRFWTWFYDGSKPLTPQKGGGFDDFMNILDELPG